MAIIFLSSVSKPVVCMKFQINNSTFKSINIHSELIEGGIMYFIISPETGMEDFFFKSLNHNKDVAIVNSPTKMTNSIKVGTIFNGGNIDFNEFRRLLRLFDLTDKEEKNVLTAFKLAIMAAYESYELIIMTTAGLSEESVYHLIVFLKQFFIKNQNKSIIIIHDGLSNSENRCIDYKFRLLETDVMDIRNLLFPKLS